MPGPTGSLVSSNEAQFILKALKEGHRVDGRQPLDFRAVKYKLSEDDSGAEVLLGRTRVFTAVTAELAAPFGDRGNEGRVSYHVELSPLAVPTFEGARAGGASPEVTALLERALRDSGAVDTEALCVVAGRKVWSVRVDVHVLSADGNIGDAVVLCALAALLAFRRPAVSLGGSDGSQIIVHSKDEKESVPLSVHHLPFSITFALFEGGQLIAVDPGRSEDICCEGHLTAVVNAHGEVCAVHKADGCPLSTDQIMRCIRAAVSTAENLTTQLRAAIESHERARIAQRVRRHTVPQDALNGAQQVPVS
mmetsp:Transcript_673/g.1956  ORF Transcript_673/g.1956 Transcript_673/m.1956 type:complete len:307 (-) Transcript_673:74-994(-)